MIRHILWDVDGTLFDTYPAMTNAFSKALNTFSTPVPLNVIDGLIRQSLDHCVETLAKRQKIDPDGLRRLFQAYYRMMPPENQKPVDRVKDVCELIRDKGGLNVAVTHRDAGSTELLLSVHRLKPFFAGIVSVDHGYPRKPDPTIFQAALRQFQLDPEATLAVGDRGIDILAAKSAGLRACFYGQPDISVSPDFRVFSYRELLALISCPIKTSTK